jgi:hypothetical protein
MKKIAVIPDPQVNVELEILQEHLEDFKVKLEPESYPSQHLLKIFLMVVSNPSLRNG